MFDGQKHRGEVQRSVPRSLRNMDHKQAVILPKRAAWGVVSENFSPHQSRKTISHTKQFSPQRVAVQTAVPTGGRNGMPGASAPPARRDGLFWERFVQTPPPKNGSVPIRTHRTPADEITPPIPASVILLHFSLADSNRCLSYEVSPTRNRKFK